MSPFRKRTDDDPVTAYIGELKPAERTAVLVADDRAALADELDQAHIRAEAAEAERDEYRAALKVAGDEVAAAIAERDAAQAQLAAHLKDCGSLPTLNVDWDEPIPDDAGVDDDDPLHGLTREARDWPAVPGDRGDDYGTYALVADAGTEPVEGAE